MQMGIFNKFHFTWGQEILLLAALIMSAVCFRFLDVFITGLRRTSLSDETWPGCALPLFLHQFAQMHWHSNF